MLLYLAIAHQIKKSILYRGDSKPTLDFYPIEEKHPEIERSAFSFYSGKWKLRGYKYWLRDSKPKGVIVFFHGITTGHYGYLNMIAYFADKGYLVYAYDERGSVLSEGDVIFNLAEAATAQKPFYDFLSKEEGIKGLPLYSVGHSWGGYASLCSLRFPQVDKVVSISGFDSPLIVCRDRAKILKYLGFEFKIYQRLHYGKQGNISSLRLMKETSKPVFYMQGDKDAVVNFHDSGERFMEELKDKPNISFYIKKNSFHNPYWDRKVEEYYDKEVKGEGGAMDFDRKPSFKPDNERLFSLEEDFMARIIDFLEKGE